MGTRRENAPDDFWTLHRHDAREIAALFDRRSNGSTPLITATITSPPYGALKNYGAENQIGYGQTYEEYLRDMGRVFGEIHKRTAEDGSLWLIADTYMSKGPPPHRLLPVPFDLANAAEECGWTLRDVIIWQKDRTLPWSNGTRLRNAFEYILLLVKGPNPKYRISRLREHQDLKDWWIRFPERYNPEGKAPPNVWDIPIPKQGSWGNGEVAHSCPLPPELVERLILLSSDEGDAIFDPFAGSGIVVAEAERLNRLGVGTELVEQNVDEFVRIVRPEILLRETDPTTVATNGNGNGAKVNEATPEVLIKLRILKLAVVLMRHAARRRESIAWPLCALVFPRAGMPSNGNLAAAKVVFVVRGLSAAQRRVYANVVKDLLKRPPASKFGIECEIEVITPKTLAKRVAGRRIFLYRNGRTSRALRSVPHRDLDAVLEDATPDSVPPVLSSIHVDVPPRSEASLRRRVPATSGTVNSGDGSLPEN
jgi:DNA modification methylase